MFRPMQEPPQTSGCFEQAEAFMKQFAKDAGLLIYSAGGDTACPDCGNEDEVYGVAETGMIHCPLCANEY